MYEFQYRPLYFLLNTEVIVVLLLVFFVCIRRIIDFFIERAANARIKRLKAEIVIFLSKPGQLDTVCILKGKERELIPVLEGFDQRFKEAGWYELKKHLLYRGALAKARRWTSSIHWKRRCFAARCFALLPLKEDEEKIISLVKDKNFLVFSNAVRAGIALESKEIVRLILRRMGTSFRYGYYFCVDALRTATHPIIESLLELATDEEYHNVVLDILSTYTLETPFPNLEEDLNSSDLWVRKNAIAHLSKNPREETIPYLIGLTFDESEEIRYKAVAALAKFSREDVIRRLDEIYNSADHWKVRLEAALSLKEVGQTAKFENAKDEETRAYGQYAIEFGEEWIQKRL